MRGEEIRKFIFLTSRPEIEVTRSKEELGDLTEAGEGQSGGGGRRDDLFFLPLQSHNHSVLAAVCLALPPRFLLFTGLLNHL